MRHRFQTAIGVVFPPRCVGCGDLVETDFALCAACWGQTPFITGLVCHACGVPLPGMSDGAPVHCDDCMKTPRPWTAGRAAVLYRDHGRKLVLSMKHGGRTEIARLAARWMVRAGQPLMRDEMLVVPVPLHWTRLFHRTYNQSAVLAQAVADMTGHRFCPDLVRRSKRTVPLDHKSAQQRFDMLEHAIEINPRRQHLMTGRDVLLIDDVMTSGATLTSATRACQAAQSGDVFVLTLARVAKDT